MFENLDLKDVGIIASLTATAVGAIAGYIKLGNKVDTHAKDIVNNDKRIRKDIGEEDQRTKERFDKVENTVEILREDHSESKIRFTKLETDVSHTRETVDKMSNGLDEMVKQITIVATKIDKDN